MTKTQNDFEDRLLDLALEEQIGGEQPTDLSSAILSASTQVENARQVERLSSTDAKKSWTMFAASLCLLVGLALMSNYVSVTEVAESDPIVAAKADPIEQRVEQFNRLINEGRFAEAEVVLRLVKQAAPNHPVVETMAWKSKFAARVHNSMSNRKKTEEGWIDAISSVEELTVAFDNRDMQFVHVAENWQTLPQNLRAELKMRVIQDAFGISNNSPTRARGGNSVDFSVFQRIEYDTPGPNHPLPNSLLGKVTEISPTNKHIAEVSLGSDDGLKLGQRLNLRNQNSQVGMAVVRKLDTHAAIIEIQRETLRRDLQKGDIVIGIKPETNSSRFSKIVENPFVPVAENSTSTFSIDVDTASFSKLRNYLLTHRRLPPPDAVRIEELLNYFPYGYEPPKSDDKHPFASHVEIADCPWNAKHRLVRIGIKGREMEQKNRPASNLVFLIDVSGSMNQPNKLPLVVEGMKMLVGQLAERDRVAIVVYAGTTGVRLEATPGDKHIKIREVLNSLKAEGSTNGGEGIRRAYQIATDSFIDDGINRVILCTDGDFNVGMTETENLVDMAAEHSQSGVYLSVLGFGMDNHNDEMLEAVSNRANGNYAFIDNVAEARKVLVEQINSTLVTIAKDVKIQVEFNSDRVASYRLIGYENRVLANKDFDDDKKDAGEIGAGHAVTALYEIEPLDKNNDPFLTLRLRYKQPDEDKSTLVKMPSAGTSKPFAKASQDFQFTAAVASFGMLLRGSAHKGNATLAAAEEIAASSKGKDEFGYRGELVRLIKRARELSKD